MPDEHRPPEEREESQDEGSEPDQAPEGDDPQPLRPDAAADGQDASVAAALGDGPLARAALERCRIVFCTGDAEAALLSKPKLAGLMQAITVGTTHAKLLMQGLEALAAKHAVLAVEVRRPWALSTRHMRLLTRELHAFRAPTLCWR